MTAQAFISRLSRVPHCGGCIQFDVRRPANRLPSVRASKSAVEESGCGGVQRTAKVSEATGVFYKLRCSDQVGGVRRRGRRMRRRAVDKSSGKVLLGVDELYAGVPGEGPLKLEDVEHWVADPKNNEVLDFELPLGLSAGADQVVGVAENPLTRAKIELGRQLYFDPRRSRRTARSISCASCHTPDKGLCPTHAVWRAGISGQIGGTQFASELQPQSARDPVLGRPGHIARRSGGRSDRQPDRDGQHPRRGRGNHQKEPDLSEGIRPSMLTRIGRSTSLAPAMATFERTLVTGPSPYDYEDRLRPFASVDLDDMKTDDPELYQKYPRI